MKPDLNQEIKVDMIPVQVDYICPSCKNGYMVFANKMVPSISGTIPAFYHKCNNCNHTISFDGFRYPRIEYREIVE